MNYSIEELKRKAILNSTARSSSLKDMEPVGLGSFSTFLRNFQLLNLVCVSVNVSTNHEDGPVPLKSMKTEKRAMDYHRDIFGEPTGETSEDTLVNGFVVQTPNKPTSSSTCVATRIPLLFNVMPSDHHEIILVSTTSSYEEILVIIGALVVSSPNCADCNTRQEKDGVPKVGEINVKWDIGTGNIWATKKTKLTEENCEAVMLMLERTGKTKINVLEVRLQKFEDGDDLEEKETGEFAIHGSK